MNWFGFKTAREKELELCVDALKEEIQRLNLELDDATRPNVEYYEPVENPRDVTEKYTDEIKHELMKNVSPILKREVINAISKIDWYDSSQSSRVPSLEMAYSPSSEIYRYHIKLPEINYRFAVYGYRR